MLFMVATLFAACANEDIAQDKKKENGTEAPKGGVVFATNDTKISAKRRFIDEDEFADAKTRTNIKHTPNKGADAYWTSDDFIWVKKQDGTWVKSTGTTLHDGGASAEFTLPGNKTDYANGCEVRYTGIGQAYYRNSPSYLTIGIPDNQSRTAANDFSHAGEWGDCGSGKAYNTGNPDKFNFSLSHKAAYLCFLPRCTNGALAPNIRLKSIKIDAEIQYTTTGFFANYSEFDGEDIRNTDGTPFGGNIITVTLPDFPLYTTANQEANATYLVVRPGKYDFSIEYTIKDPTTNVETVIKDTRTGITLEKENIYDVTANLVPKSGSGLSPQDFKYYMWDAKQHYWYGYEDDQPIINFGHPGAHQGWHYPKSKAADPQRWYNDTWPGYGIPYEAQTARFKALPNINEMCWYVMKGDPHWDANGIVGHVIASDGHLKQASLGGIWLLKKAAIVRRLTDPGKPGHYPSTLTWEKMKEGYGGPGTPASPIASPTDIRTPAYMGDVYQNTSIVQGRPSDTEISDYFFLPAAGQYSDGHLYFFGEWGFYWSSTAGSQGDVDSRYLYIGNSKVGLHDYYYRSAGQLVRPFE